MSQAQSTAAAAASRKTSRRLKAKPSCEDCYFGRRMLCALELGEPCSTFRPDSPEGLVPPTQPMLLVRSEPDPAHLGLQRAA
ncbi:MAG: hypothetical protein JJE23_11510 [Thermoleophilia bacterium]|nr:hypothetical protein [Thermoleophilia bacterium]